MSTNDVPGYNPSNRDHLHAGCWAEHKDGSLIFVEGTEAEKVVYSLFDPDKDLEYRDVMERDEFELQFSVYEPSDDDGGNGGKKKKGAKRLRQIWTWHDKTPFPWDTVLKGMKTGARPISAAHTLSAAEQVARDLALRASNIDSKRARKLKDRLMSIIEDAFEDGE